MDIIIRPVRLEDASAINDIRRMDGVMENTLGMKSDRYAQSEEFLKGLDKNTHMLVAEAIENNHGHVVGICGLSIEHSPRMRHAASVGISVHRDYQGMGIGKKLMEAILDIADNWLMLVRVELAVFTDNEKAIGLYRKMGFELEGTRRYAAIRSGRLVDEHIMARYNLIRVE